MTYNKPPHITYTDMAIWIDRNMENPAIDEEKLYEYLYHLAFMLAHEKSFYSNMEIYDQFSLFSASKLFLRLRDDRQFKGELQKIKSVLNYLKAVIYPYKVDFDNQFQSPAIENATCLYTNVDFADIIAEDLCIFDQIDFRCSIDSIDHIIKSYLRKIPFNRRTAEWENIYLSCILTILNSITCSASQLAALKDRNVDNYMLSKQYRSLASEEPILYHLDRSMSGYIKVLVNELKEVIAKELSIESSGVITSDASMKTLLIQMIEEANGTDNE